MLVGGGDRPHPGVVARCGRPEAARAGRGTWSVQLDQLGPGDRAALRRRREFERSRRVRAVERPAGGHQLVLSPRRGRVAGNRDCEPIDRRATEGDDPIPDPRLQHRVDLERHLGASGCCRDVARRTGQVLIRARVMHRDRCRIASRGKRSAGGDGRGPGADRRLCDELHHAAVRHRDRPFDVRSLDRERATPCRRVIDGDAAGEIRIQLDRHGADRRHRAGSRPDLGEHPEHGVAGVPGTSRVVLVAAHPVRPVGRRVRQRPHVEVHRGGDHRIAGLPVLVQHPVQLGERVAHRARPIRRPCPSQSRRGAGSSRSRGSRPGCQAA